MGTVVKIRADAFEVPATASRPTDLGAVMVAAGSAGIAAAGWWTVAWFAAVRLGVSAGAGMGRPAAGGGGQAPAGLPVCRPWPQPASLRLCRGSSRM